MNKKTTKKIAASLAVMVGSTNGLPITTSAAEFLQVAETTSLQSNNELQATTESAIDLPSIPEITTEAAINLEAEPVIGIETTSVTITEGIERPLVTVTLTDGTTPIANKLAEANINMDTEFDLTVITQSNVLLEDSVFDNCFKYSVVDLDMSGCYAFSSFDLIVIYFKNTIRNINLDVTPNSTKFSIFVPPNTHIGNITICDTTTISVRPDYNPELLNKNISIDKIMYSSMSGSSVKNVNGISLAELTIGEIDTLGSENTRISLEKVTYLNDFTYKGRKSTTSVSSDSITNCIFKGNVTFVPDILEGAALLNVSNNIVEGDCTIKTDANFTFRLSTVLGTLKVVDSKSIQTIMFDRCTLNNVELCDGIEVIGGNAFWSTKGIRDITLPESVRTIQERAFQYSTIQNLFNAENVTLFKKSAFMYCSQLQSVKIGKYPNTVLSESVFEYCTSLSNVEFLDGPITLGPECFSSINAEQIIIPSNISNIPEDAFSHGKIKKLVFEHGENDPLSIEEDAFLNNQIEGKLTVHPNITALANGAFSSNKITEVYLPPTTVSLGRYAFSDNKISKINLTSNLTSVGDNALAHNQISDVDFQVLKNCTFGESAFEDNLIEGTVDLTSRTKLLSRTFKDNPKITKVIAPDMQTTGEQAFDNCKSLSSLIYPVKGESNTIGLNAFRYCALDLAIGETYNILSTYTNNLASIGSFQKPAVTYNLTNETISTGMMLKDIIDVTTLYGMPLSSLLRTNWYDNSNHEVQMDYRVYEIIDGKRIEKSKLDSLTKGTHTLVVEPGINTLGTEKTLEFEVVDTAFVVKPMVTIYDKLQPLDLKQMVRVFINGFDVTSLDVIKVSTSIDLSELTIGTHEVPITVTYKDKTITVTSTITVIDINAKDEVDVPPAIPLPSNYEILEQVPYVSTLAWYNSDPLCSILNMKKDGKLMTRWDFSGIGIYVYDALTGENLTLQGIKDKDDLWVGKYTLRFELTHYASGGKANIEVPVDIQFSNSTLGFKEIPQYEFWTFAKNRDVIGTELDLSIKYRKKLDDGFTDYTGEDAKITLAEDISNLEVSQPSSYTYVKVRLEIPSMDCDIIYNMPVRIVEDINELITLSEVPIIAPTIDAIDLSPLKVNYNFNDITNLCNITLLTNTENLVMDDINDVQYRVVCEKYGIDTVINRQLCLGNILPTESVIFDYQSGSTLQEQLQSMYPTTLPTDLTIVGSGIITANDMNYLSKQKIKRLDLSMANTNLTASDKVSFQNNVVIEEYINFKTKKLNIQISQFKDCVNLRKVDLGLADIIYSEGFNGCTKLEQIIGIEQVNEIGEMAFQNCKSLKSLTIGTTDSKDLLWIKDRAFTGSGLESIEIKGNRSANVDEAFYSAKSFTTFKADPTVWFDFSGNVFKDTSLTGDLELTTEDFYIGELDGHHFRNIRLKAKAGDRYEYIYLGGTFKNCTIESFYAEASTMYPESALFDNCTINTLELKGNYDGYYPEGFYRDNDNKNIIVKDTLIENLIFTDIAISAGSDKDFVDCTINNIVFDNSRIASIYEYSLFYRCKGKALKEFVLDVSFYESDSSWYSNGIIFKECLGLEKFTYDFTNTLFTVDSEMGQYSPIAVDCPNLTQFEIINKPSNFKIDTSWDEIMVGCGYIPTQEFMDENFLLYGSDISEFFGRMIPYIQLTGGKSIEIFENDVIPFHRFASLTTLRGENYNDLIGYDWYDLSTHEQRTTLDFEIVNKKTRQKADYTKALPEGEYLVYTKLLNDTDPNRAPVVSTLIVKSTSDLHSEGKDLFIVEGESVDPKLLYSATFGDENQDVTDLCTFEILNDTDLTHLPKGTHEINLMVNYNGYSDLATSTITVLEKQGEASIVGNVIAPSSDLEIKINDVVTNKQNVNTVVSVPQDVVINIVDKNNIYKPTEIIVPITLEQIKANDKIQLEDIVLEQHALELTTKQVTVSDKAQVITASDFFDSLKSNGTALVPKDLIYKIMDNGTEVSLEKALQSNKTYEVILTATSDIRSVSESTQLIVNLQDDSKPPVTKPDDPKPPVVKPEEPESPTIKPNYPIEKVIDNFPYTLPKGYDLKPLLNGIKVLKGDVDTFGIKNFKVEKNGAVGTFDVLSDNLGEDIPKLPFTDTLKHWAGEDIEKARVLGIVKGSETDLFKPNRAVTISESLAILDRVFLSNGMVAMTSTRSTVEYALPSKEMWYYFNAGSILSKMDRQEVTKANNLIKGNYSRAITRGELALILSQICDTLPTVNTQKYIFTDTYNSPYNVALQDCWAKGLLVGKSSTKMAPKDTLTRAELTVIALRLHNLSKEIN